ncbi:MAG: PAS domain S-box protein [Deltaproteobacteria bacterium]|nr:PAS domain S-box protein [Deltaproteobacteria bacterium]
MSSLDELRRENSELRSRLAELERALAEAAAHEQARSRVVSVVEASSEAILSTAMDGTILSWNPAAQRLFGFTAGEAVGRIDLEIVPFELLVEHQHAVERALRGEAVMIETRRRRRDGTSIAVSVIYARLADPTGKPLGISTMSHASPRTS